MDSDEEETFVELGTPLPEINEDEPRKKLVSAQELAAKDSKGRRRFHGAFTGGFSAGYFNSVGSKEGFKPSTFVSSRQKKSEEQQQLQPEDFMDDEDLGEYGFAPRKLVTAESYTSEERRKRKLEETKLMTSGTIFSGESALTDLIVPEKLSIGIKLLRKLGWKEGQGLGPRVRRKVHKRKPNVKVYGCAMPPSDDDESSGEDLPSDVTFAPKDTNPITLTAKDNVHGLGYSGINPRAALPSTHINLFGPPPISKSGRKGITGQAFGVGALEDEDMDIYGTDHISNYDVTMEIDDGEEKLYGWTAPGRKQSHVNKNIPIGYIGKVLEGFKLSSKPLKEKRNFGPPNLPKGYIPVHKFSNSVSDEGGSKNKLNAVARGLILGDVPILDINKNSSENKNKIETDTKDENRVSRFSSGRSDNVVLKEPKGSRFSAAESIDNKKHSQKSQQMPAEGQKSRFVSSFQSEHVQLTPHGTNSTFKPFAKNAKKQERYEKYVSLSKTGSKDAYEQVADSCMTEWEKEKEKEEFVGAAKLYKPMSGMMASRFTSAKYSDDTDKVDIPKDDGDDKDDQMKAAEMKMYGRLTHDILEWHPDKLLCRRFNVPDPYPGSSIIGLPTVKRDKYSVFTFLNFDAKPLAEQPEVKALPAPPQTESLGSDSSTLKPRQRHAPLKSIFSVLMKDPPKSESSKPTQSSVTPSESTASIQHSSGETTQSDKSPTSEPAGDLFAAIFGNTDSESSSEEDTPATIEINVVTEQNKTSSTSVSHVEEKDKQTNLENSGKTGQATVNSNKMNNVISETGAMNSMRDGSQSLQDRLSPQVDEDEFYGPALPTSVLTSSKEVASSYRSLASKSERQSTSSSKKHKHKDRSRERHKHKKEKKSKHKKEKHKKKDKKKDKKKKKYDSGNDASSSDVDSSISDDSSAPSNREILSKLKSLGSKGRQTAAEFM